MSLEQLISQSSNGISRRHFFKKLAAVVTIPNLIEEQVPKTVITFEEAKANEALRQQYINQLVERIFGAEDYMYIKNFIYDNNSSKSNKELTSIAKRLAEDERYYKKMSRDLKNNELYVFSATTEYNDDPRFASYNSTDKISKIKEFLETPEGIKDYSKKVSERNLKRVLASKNVAITPLHDFDFGKGIRSNVYIKSSAFEDEWIFTSDGSGRIEFPATEEGMIALLKHEYKHAKDFYAGIKEEGLEISNKDTDKIEPRLLKLMMELMALKDDFYETQKLNKETGNEFERYHPAYRKSVVALVFVDVDLKRLKSSGILDIYNDNILKLQQNKYKVVMQEVKRIIAELNRMYGKR